MGYANPDRMLESMPSLLISEWQAFFLWRKERDDEDERRRTDAKNTSGRAKQVARAGGGGRTFE